MARDLQRLARMKEELRSYIYYNLKPLEEIYYKDGGAATLRYGRIFAVFQR